MTVNTPSEIKSVADNCKMRYAQAFVINQAYGENMYEPMEALSKATIFPSLYMPYTFWRFNKGN